MLNMQEHLLTILGEEGAEVSQAVSKIMRFGLNDINPKTNRTNYEALVTELNDVAAILEMLSEVGMSFPGLYDRAEMDAKKARVRNMMEYSYSRGRLIKE
jgi:hypothetical protein